MARNNAYIDAERKIEKALRTRSIELSLSGGYNDSRLTELPESLRKLTQLQILDLSENKLTALPDWMGELTQLHTLYLSGNQLTTLPDWLGQLTRLRRLELESNRDLVLPDSLSGLVNLRRLNIARTDANPTPEVIFKLTGLTNLDISGNSLPELAPDIALLINLEHLDLCSNNLVSLPKEIVNLKALRYLNLGTGWGETNKIRDLPIYLLELASLNELDLTHCPLNPELEAAYKQGLNAVKAYLKAKAEDQIVLNEAKLILVGEGEVGKSCLLDALRGEQWQKHVSTHGIEIKPVTVMHRNDKGLETEITLNTWDFGGQKVYRPTHQLFFSAPAVYLVVWKPREGPQQGAVEYWINTIKHRAGADAKVMIVATHGGPQQRQPDIDVQDLRDKFGADTILACYHVDSRPELYDEANDTWTGERKGITKLKEAIANVAFALPNVGREVATSWNNVLKNVKKRSEKDPYISYTQFKNLCRRQKVDNTLAKTYAGMLTQLGYVIHYATDDDLKDIMILKPDWLAKAISFVLDDKMTRDRNGLVSHNRLSELWSKPPYENEIGYPRALYPLFTRLMERFDISYQVVVDPASHRPITTSLIAQLVDDKPKPLPDWDEHPLEGDEEKRQICQIVEGGKNQSANAEGLFFRLIARLHKYSIGREDYSKSIHWQRGLMLDDGYNGQALLRHIGNDIHITVRAAYPERFIHQLTHEVKWLVENPDEGWAGLRCEIMVPCIAPCGLNDPGRGRFEVRKLVLNKKNNVNKVLCPATDCEQFHSVDELMRNATITRQSKLSDNDINQIRAIVDAKDAKDEQRYRALFSQADEQLAILMQVMLDEARNGPRLFSLTPTDTGFLDNPSWLTQKFQLTLWCEHSHKPLPALWEDTSRGTYKLERPREWLVKYGPALRTVTKTLGAILPVVAVTTKIAIPDETYKGIEKGIDFGKELFGAILKGGGEFADISGDDILSDAEHGEARQV